MAAESNWRNFIDRRRGQAFSQVYSSIISKKGLQQIEFVQKILFNMHGCPVFIEMFHGKHCGRNRKIGLAQILSNHLVLCKKQHRAGPEKVVKNSMSVYMKKVTGF
ncbi:hypothetical protein HMPREF3213_00528 [Heyndrickxia coagulans]|uniref:Uncharacterized protein n=1 Tax=Heyndrickxia coagulans TaxID=1398 RepID=A0A133L029_HEYCO|nr:hypothetical protein HMPREF3213_00528 [Heyndrickxia coagulans]